MSETRWARADGVHVAFRTKVGNPGSDVVVVFVPGMFIPIDLLWDDPVAARFLDGLASLGTLVVFDRRGVGDSDPVTDWERPIAEQWADDAAAVLDELGLAGAHVVGWNTSGGVGPLLSLRRPDLVASVTIFHSGVPTELISDALGLSLVDMANSIAEWVLDGGDLAVAGPDNDASGAALFHPSRTGDSALEVWLEEAGRRGASPGTAARIWRAVLEPGRGFDTAQVTAPVLVVWRKDNTFLPASLGRSTAAAFPNAAYVEVPGRDPGMYSGDPDPVVAEIQQFITGEAPAVPSGSTELVAVLFTDIVGSTATAHSMSSDAWRGLLDAHDRLTRRVVGRHGGRIVKQTGDGMLACFGLASQAVRAAIELRTEVSGIGIDIRQGVHVGEVVNRDGDLAGPTVHAAARVMGHAGAGEILVSQVVPLLVTSGLVFEPAGERQLAGLPGEWALARVVDGPAEP